MRSIWTDEKIAELRRLRAAGYEWKDIATRLCITIATCKHRWLVLTQTEAQKKERQERKALRDRRKRAPFLKRIPHRDSESVTVPDSVWVERNARLAETLSLTGWMLGDPVPSRSALAQREVRA